MGANPKTISVLIVVLALSCVPFGCAGSRGKVVDKWEPANQTFKIRITEYQENKTWLPALPGYYYVFESAVVGSDMWREVMTAHTDDDVGIPRNQTHFVNDRVGYVFMGQTYAVTIDGGRTWSPWNGKAYYADAYIKEVRVEADGAGVMTFHPNPINHQQARELHTDDFGQSWRI